MNLFLLSGGRHPYDESTPVLLDCLRRAGHEVTETEDPGPLADRCEMATYDAVVFNTRRENLPGFADLLLSEGEREGLAGCIRDGLGFLCLHISTCLPPEWPEFHQITGGGWITGTSFHPPYGGFRLHVADTGHAVAAGVGDFDTVDELYMGLAVAEDRLTADVARQPGAGPSPVPAILALYSVCTLAKGAANLPR